MSKQKTRKVVAKRFKTTKTGKVKRKICHTSHLNRKDDANASIRKKKMVDMKGKFAKKIKNMLSA